MHEEEGMVINDNDIVKTKEEKSGEGGESGLEHRSDNCDDEE